MAGEEFLQPHPLQQPVDDRQRTHGMGDDAFSMRTIGALSIAEILGPPRLGLCLWFSLRHVDSS